MGALCSQAKSIARLKATRSISVGSMAVDELVDVVDTYREVLPKTIIPIGDDAGGNQFCLGLDGKDFGKVYFHNHGLGWHADAEAYRERGDEVPESIRYQTVYEIASSFEQFILKMVKRV